MIYIYILSNCLILVEFKQCTLTKMSINYIGNIVYKLFSYFQLAKIFNSFTYKSVFSRFPTVSNLSSVDQSIYSLISGPRFQRGFKIQIYHSIPILFCRGIYYRLDIIIIIVIIIIILYRENTYFETGRYIVEHAIHRHSFV